jgi:LysR family carnitine catabolism transcriptional activator
MGMRTRLNLNALITFLEVAKHRSFRCAADNLATSQSAVSARIKKLEDYLGVKLLDRSTRTVSMTPQGYKLYESAQSAYLELSGIEKVLLQEASLNRGEVALAVMPSLAQAEIPNLLAKFREQYPGIVLHLMDVDSHRGLAMLADGTADLAIVSATVRDNQVEFEPMFWDECLVALPKKHPLAKRKKIPLAELNKYPLLVTPSGTTLRTMLEQEFTQHGLVLTPSQQIWYTPTLVQMVLSGFGIGIAPGKALKAFAHPDCELRPISEKIGWTVGIARRSSKAASPAAAAVAEFLLKHHQNVRNV